MVSFCFLVLGYPLSLPKKKKKPGKRRQEQLKYMGSQKNSKKRKTRANRIQGGIVADLSGRSHQEKKSRRNQIFKSNKKKKQLENMRLLTSSTSRTKISN